jgi:intron-binding protein aquarius
MELLGQVQKLAVSLGIPGDFGYTCETASYFQLQHIQSRLEKFLLSVASQPPTNSLIASIFPFSAFFQNTPEPIFKGACLHQCVVSASVSASAGSVNDQSAAWPL